MTCIADPSPLKFFLAVSGALLAAFQISSKVVVLSASSSFFFFSLD